MTRKYITLFCLFSGLATAPLLAQSLRIDTSRTTIFDPHGNVVGDRFEIKVEGSFESQKEQLQNKKIAFFVGSIGLTPKEAERFWPIYNEYYRKREELIMYRDILLQQLFASERTVIPTSEKDVKTLLDAYVSCTKREADLQTEYYEKFLAILPAKKVARYYQAEEQFKQILLQDIVNRRGGR